MKVVLLEDVRDHGKKGELCTVSDGYARNYLFPRKLAVEADSAALAELKSKEQAKEHHRQEELDQAKAAAAKLNGKTVEIRAKAGQNGRLFGSVTTKEIAAALKESLGVEVDKKKITAADIKSFGEYTADIKLCPGVSAAVTIKVCE